MFKTLNAQGDQNKMVMSVVFSKYRPRRKLPRRWNVFSRKNRDVTSCHQFKTPPEWCDRDHLCYQFVSRECEFSLSSMNILAELEGLVLAPRTYRFGGKDRRTVRNRLPGNFARYLVERSVQIGSHVGPMHFNFHGPQAPRQWVSLASRRVCEITRFVV